MFDRGSKLDKNSIIQTLNSHKMELKGFGVDRIGLFVSYHTNKAQPNSDIDFWKKYKRKEDF
jgi:predicted nucleotidyltransferase